MRLRGSSAILTFSFSDMSWRTLASANACAAELSAAHSMMSHSLTLCSSRAALLPLPRALGRLTKGRRCAHDSSLLCMQNGALISAHQFNLLWHSSCICSAGCLPHHLLPCVNVTI